MGLLDEAIRDHLELKRRRGADPTEVAREELEALEPVFPEEPRPEDMAQSSDPELDFVDPLPQELPPEQDSSAPVQAVGMPSEPAPEQHSPGAFSPLSEETVEIDMQAVLDADGHLPQDVQPPEQIPGQERLSFE